MQGVGERIAMKKNPGYAPTEGGMEMKKNRVYGLRNLAHRQSGSEIGTDAMQPAVRPEARREV